MKKKNIIFAASAGVTIAAALAVTVVFVNSGNEGCYEEAVRLESVGSYKDAAVLYKKLGDYKDSKERLSGIETEYPLAAYYDAQKGDIVAFGAYEQDGIAENGKEPIEWFVIDREENELLLISRYCLSCKPYYDKAGDITWEYCSLREWLNSEFLSSSFTDTERSYIVLSENENPDEDMHGTEGGNDTQDNVFLLSEIEARVYFRSDEDREMLGAAQPSEAAINEKIYISDEEGMYGRTSPWWLRSPGTYGNSAVFVEKDGSVNPNGAIVTNEYYCGVRPAVRVKTSDN